MSCLHSTPYQRNIRERSVGQWRIRLPIQRRPSTPGVVIIINNDNNDNSSTIRRIICSKIRFPLNSIFRRGIQDFALGPVFRLLSSSVSVSRRLVFRLFSSRLGLAHNSDSLWAYILVFRLSSVSLLRLWTRLASCLCLFGLLGSLDFTPLSRINIASTTHIYSWHQLLGISSLLYFFSRLVDPSRLASYFLGLQRPSASHHYLGSNIASPTHIYPRHRLLGVSSLLFVSPLDL